MAFRLQAVPTFEADTLRQCRAILERYKLAGLLTYRRISTTGVPRVAGGGKIRFTKNEAKGMADILVFAKTDPPRVLHLELKSSHGPLTEAQEQWRDELAKMGHMDYFVVRHWQGLYDILDTIWPNQRCCLR